MAKLNAHGREIGRLYYTTFVEAYFADGKILRNSGFGWKIRAKAKEGANIVDIFNRAKAKQVDFLAKRPALAAYRKELHSMAGMGKAWKLHAVIEIMFDDCDGVWSECCNGYGDNVSADVDEVGYLCELYKNAAKERESLVAQSVTA